MHQFSYIAHAGHVHAEKAESAVTISPLMLGISVVVLLMVIVGGALISYRATSQSRPSVPENKHQ